MDLVYYRYKYSLKHQRPQWPIGIVPVLGEDGIEYFAVYDARTIQRVYRVKN